MSAKYRAKIVAATLGALISSGATLAQSTQTVMRQVEFHYNTTTGLLDLERVDPGLPSCVETLYEHDEYSNRKKVTVQPCAGVTSPTFDKRVTDFSFDGRSGGSTDTYPAGAYNTKSIARRPDNSVAKQTEAQYDARFGAPTVQTDVAHVNTAYSNSSRTVYDEFGRPWKKYAPVKRVGGVTTESYVEQLWTYCEGAFKPTPKPAACIEYTPQVSASYASGMLVDAGGNPVSTSTVRAITAYFVEATPRDAAGNVIGARSRVHYDSLHREFANETENFDGRWIVTLKAFNALGMEAIRWGAHFGRDAAGTIAPSTELAQWTSAYDLLHRPSESRHFWRAEGGATATEVASQISYNGLEGSVTIPDVSSPDGVARTETIKKNPIGKVAQVVDPYGATLNSAYDPVGNLVRTVDALGNTTTIGYTLTTARFKISMTEPNTGTWTYAYDALGQLISQTDARNKTSTMSYDVMGRLVTKTNPTQNGSWYYDKDANGAWCANGLNRLCEAKAAKLQGPAISAEKVTAFDELGRPTETTSTIDRAYVSRVTYDALGRVSTQRYPTGFTVKYGYSQAGTGKIAGVLEMASDNADANRVFWSIADSPSLAFDARGNLVRSLLGNGLSTNHAFDPISGKAFSMRTGTAAGGYVSAQSISYSYDKVDNVMARVDHLQGVAETYTHDRLNRLSSYHVASSSDAGANRDVVTAYNAIGNVLSKSDLGGYQYAGGRPHAVSSAGGTDYTYDANGNLTATTGNQGRTITWTDFNQVESMSYRSDRTVAFKYDQSYRRVEEVSTQGSTQRTLRFVHPDNRGGLAFEREETRVNGSLTRNESRHYISVGAAVVAVVKTLDDAGVVSAEAGMTNYWHKDALGSVVVVSGASGGVIERMGYDAWGRRVRQTGMADPTLDPANGDRGFTGHEHLDEVALVHMNGRIYDPLLARFLSADPVVGNLNDLQTYNRYSYVMNQPLRYTDPSGECGICVAMFLVGTVMVHEGNKYWAMVGQIMQFVGARGFMEGGLNVGTWSPNPMNSAAAAGASALASGQGLDGAIKSAIFAAAFTQVGTKFDGDWTMLLTAHALLGCVQSSVSGGQCGPGAMSAFVGKAVTLGLVRMEVTDRVVIGIVTTIAGGTAAEIGGGKFVNGAFQAGFGYIFNYLSHSRAAGPYVDQLRAGSGQAREMLDAMAADPNTNYYIDVGSVPESAGGGTTRIQQPSLSLWDRVFGRSAPSATVIMTVDVSSQVQFLDVGGQSFQPSAARILAHELGHGYTYLLGGYVGYRANYDAAIRYENQISRQLNSGAPLRAISDHGRGP